MTTMATKNQGASPAPMMPAPEMSREVRKAFIVAAFAGAGKPMPSDEALAWIQAGFLARGEKIPKWFAEQSTTPATQTPAPTPKPTPTIRESLKRLWDGVLKIRSGVDEVLVRKGLAVEVQSPDETIFAMPSSPWGTQADADRFPDSKNPDGNPHGDERIVRRRRALELERLILVARKKARGAAFADKARWDLELQELSSELESIRKAERQERDGYKAI